MASGIRFALAALIVAAALSPNLRAAPKPPTLSYFSISMTGAAWKDTLTNLEATVFESASGEPLHRSGSERHHDAVAVRICRTEQSAYPQCGKSVSIPAIRRHFVPAHSLSDSQKQALVEAWRAGYHVGLPLAFTAVVYVESKACANAHKSSKGAVGCAQVLPTTANEVAHATIPEWQLSSSSFTEENLAIGAHYLQECMEKFGWPAGIGCYDYGLNTSLTRHQLTRLHYTRVVLAAMKWLKQLPMSED